VLIYVYITACNTPPYFIPPRNQDWRSFYSWWRDLPTVWGLNSWIFYYQYGRKGSILQGPMQWMHHKCSGLTKSFYQYQVRTFPLLLMQQWREINTLKSIMETLTTKISGLQPNGTCIPMESLPAKLPNSGSSTVETSSTINKLSTKVTNL